VSRWVPVHKADQAIKAAFLELERAEETSPDASPGEVLRVSPACTQADFERVVVANGQLYGQLQELERELAQMRKDNRQLERLRAQAFHRGVVEGLKRSKDEALLEFGVSSLRIEQLIEDVDR